jgi:KaiC/GvpD/RAD55 family RecA-like ATPase
MNGSINVTHHPEHNFTIYSGNSSTGKTALLAGRAILACWHGKKVLWLSADFVNDHIRDSL